MKDELPISVKFGVGDLDLTALLDAANEVVVFADEQWRIMFCNDAYLRQTGLTREQVIGRQPFSYLPAFRRSIFYEPIERCRIERRPTAALGFSTLTQRCMLMRVLPVQGGMLMLANDASDQVVRQHQLAQMALEDPLTRLPNKLALGQDLDDWLRGGREFTYLGLRSAKYRALNDSYGSALCDLASIELASRLQQSTIPGERVYRISHDEFVHLCPGSIAASSERVAAVVDSVKKPFLLKGTAHDLGIVAGIARAPGHADEAELLMLRASMAVREAEQAHANAPVVYAPSLEAALRVRAELEGEVKQALANGQFTLFLQPKASLAGLHVTGAEALIRWSHQTRGWVTPGQFLPVLNECGLMRELDSWVLGAATRQISNIAASGAAVPVSVNLSVHSLADPDIVARVQDALRSADVAPCLLEVEIPEGELMRDVETSMRVLKGLNQLGVGLSIDDFGTGYSSFARLAKFPVQTLKIDRSFVLDMSNSRTSNRVVAGLVHLAHSLGLKVVAEGAETKAQMTMLRRIHCDEIQGYGYARPMPESDFARFVALNLTPRGPSAFSV